MLEIRWQTALDYLNEDEKKWSAMHHNERDNTCNFRLNSSANIMSHINHAINSNDSSEASQRRQTFHMRSFGSSAAPYIDDDDVSLEKITFNKFSSALQNFCETSSTYLMFEQFAD